MKHRRIKIIPVVIAISCLILLILGIIGIKKFIDYRNSYDYKLSEIGYNESEIKRIKKLKTTEIDELLKIKYNKNIADFIKQKYFIFKIKILIAATIPMF